MAGTYSMVSVPKGASNAGRPKGKKKYIVVFRWEDVQTYTRDEKGVRVTAFALFEGKKPIGVYATSSTVNVYHTSEGDDDARGFIHHVDYEHPGSTVEHDEFVNNNINEELGAIVVGCQGDDAKIAGTPCTPLFITKADSQDSKDGDKNTINMASTLRGSTIGYIAKSLIPATDNDTINAELGITGQTGSGSGGSTGGNTGGGNTGGGSSGDGNTGGGSSDDGDEGMD